MFNSDEDQRKLKEIINQFNKSNEAIRELFREFSIDLSNKMKSISEKISINLKDIEVQLKKTIEQTPESVYELSKYGWFIDLNFEPSTAIELSIKIKENKIEQVNEYLMQYYRENLKSIETKLSKKNINRKKIFHSAFKNHKKGDYVSSIIVLLTQVDGICFDRLKKKFFINSKKKNDYLPEIAEELKKTSDWLINLLSLPITKKTGINIRELEIENFPIRLNRHEIIHGVDTNFASEINSLKVISFINYIDEIIDLIKE